MRKARRYFVLVVALAVLMLSACAAGPNEMVDTGPDPAGFWLGLWQGLISPITFLICVLGGLGNMLGGFISLFTQTSTSTRSKTTGTGTTSASCWEWSWRSAVAQAEVPPQPGDIADGAEPRRLCRSYGPRRPHAGGVALSTRIVGMF